MQDRQSNGSDLLVDRAEVHTLHEDAMEEIHRIAILGNHLPRLCGIATFTADLSEAIDAQCPGIDCFVLAMNDRGRRHGYPDRVRVEIDQNDVASYRSAADFLNAGEVDLLSVQHEFGIYGGKAGSHVLALLRELKMPIVSTLHTVLAMPDPMQRLAMDELTRISDRVVVMSEHGRTLLGSVHGVSPEKIDVIPHGIPDVPFAGQAKKRLGFEGKSVILTFGLLSPDKGIENVIEAMPAILDRHPDTVYIVVGATHPHVKEQHGESYRSMLQDRAVSLGLNGGMAFCDRFVSKAELVEYLSAADIYVTPYLNQQQITSGTLAFAVGSGKAVISTPYSYARELLADGRGILVPWRDPTSIAREVNGLLDDGPRCMTLRRRAKDYGRHMRWPDVARAYVESFTRARAQHVDHDMGAGRRPARARSPLDLPAINIDHLRMLSDRTGILQHAAFNVPRYEDGYCLDDNARALIFATLLEEAGTKDAKALGLLASRYLAFVSHSFDPAASRFKNFMSYSRVWVEERGSQDSHGRALWALGTVAGRCSDAGRQCLADGLLHAALPGVVGFTSPRAWAYALLGIDEYTSAFQDARGLETIRKQLAGRLLDLYRRSSGPAWAWFEDRVTYCNARLSQAMIVSGAAMGEKEMMASGLVSLEWLASIQCSREGFFAPVGSDGFFERGKDMAAFDQQPVEAGSMLSACLAAFRVTGDARWADEARRAFDWFLGRNQLRRQVYDPSTGGCRDGLHADRPNENQGAESTISFLIALVEMQSLRPDMGKTARMDALGTAS